MKTVQEMRSLNALMLRHGSVRLSQGAKPGSTIVQYEHYECQDTLRFLFTYTCAEACIS